MKAWGMLMRFVASNCRRIATPTERFFIQKKNDFKI